MPVPRRIFLTGAAGRLARFLLPVLRDANHHVIGIDVRKPETPDPTVDQVRELNLLDTPATHAAMQAAQPDTLIHLANHAWPRARPPAQLFNENITMTMNVFDAARSLGIRRIIYASTVQVMAGETVPGYSPRPPQLAYLPLDGDSPPDPVNSYGLSKQIGEVVLAQWATEMELQAVSLRFPMLIDFDLPYVKKWRAGEIPEPTPTVIAQGFSWLSYRDAAQLIAALLSAQWTGARIYYPAAPGPRALQSVEALIAKYYQNAPRKPGHEHALDSLVDISAITRQTGWIPRDTQFLTSPAPA